MRKSFVTFTAALCLLLLAAAGRAGAAPDSVAGDYRIGETSRPDGGGGYRGKVNIKESGPSFRVQWTLDSGESYNGPGILLDGVLGVGYGEGLTGLAVYEIKGRTLKAKWLLPATPQDVGAYELAGTTPLNGYYKFTNGVAGGVTVKPHGKVYDITWSLPTGSFGGIGIRSGDVLVAVSGTPGSNYGVVAYRAVEEHVEGIWTMPGQTDVGTETLLPAGGSGGGGKPAAGEEKISAAAGAGSGGSSGAARFDGGGKDVVFAGEKYHLEDGFTKPGEATSELREYLRPGENFDHYAKMVALRVQNVGNTAPLAFARDIMNRTKKDYPDSETHEIEHTDNSATVEFLIVSGATVEYNFWHFSRTPQGLASVQFVLRNQPPFETKEKFKAEQNSHGDAWVRDAKALAPLVTEALAKTAQTGGAASAAKPEKQPAAPEMSDDALAAKIAADLQTAAGIGKNFMELLQASKFDDAAALIPDDGFTRMRTSRRDFVANLQQAQKTDGRVLSFTPDKSKTDFGAEAGGMYFVLVADSKCEKTAARETLRFFRYPDGKVKMVGYQHAGKGSGMR